MPMFVFTDDLGNRHERFYTMADAPKIGERVTVMDGQTVTRVASFEIGKKWNPFGGRYPNKYPYASRSLPKTLGDCEKDHKAEFIRRVKKEWGE